MKHFPVDPEILSRRQMVEIIKHQDQAFLMIVAAATKLLILLHPDHLPNDLAAAVRCYAEVQRDIVNASKAELDRITSDRDSEPLQ